MLFLRKTDETIWRPPFLIVPPPPHTHPPPSLSTNTPTSEQFFHDPTLCPNFRSEILILGGEETMLVCIVHQTQNFQGIFQVFCSIFNLVNKEEGPQNNQEVKKFLIFFC